MPERIVSFAITIAALILFVAVTWGFETFAGLALVSAIIAATAIALLCGVAFVIFVLFLLASTFSRKG
jgi:hypothetical protein